MARIQSTMLPLGSKAPAFTLRDVVSEELVSLENIKGENGTVIMFICNHCPFVIHIEQEIVQLALDYQDKGIGFAAICSNDAEQYPDDSPEKMKQKAEELKFPFPYLHDGTQTVAKEYHAACTPDFYMFDKGLACAYRGQFDESRPNNGKPVTGDSLREALDALIQNKEVPQDQKPSLGCNIKWKE